MIDNERLPVGTLHSLLRHMRGEGVLAAAPVLFDAGQQGLQPARRALAVGVQEGDDLAFGGRRPPQPGSDQARALLHPQDPHRHLQGPHVVLQLLLQEVWHQNDSETPNS